MTVGFGPRRGVFHDAADDLRLGEHPVSAGDLAQFESLDLVYRSLCALLYNYAPMSGHPGGSVSSGRIVAGLLFDAMDYDVGDPAREDADVLSYAAGHKALGLYSMWALRDELLRVGAPELLPDDPRERLRLQDLLGFRRNPTTPTPLFRKLGAKALDGHPTPATPFVRLATGASGVGVASSIGLALAMRDWFGDDAPRVHVLEGEGGLTPGRVAEALAAAGTAGLDNLLIHVDWNQASIDSNRVCREGETPGDYVQWDPTELFWLHDWNVIEVPDGTDFSQVLAAQRRALTITNGQPTAIVYRTVKGWRYGLEGRVSHGAGHKLCSEGFFEAMSPLLERYHMSLPMCCGSGERRCSDVRDGREVLEHCLWDALEVIRRVVERESETVAVLAGRLAASRERLARRHRGPRERAPRIDRLHEMAADPPDVADPEVAPEPGRSTTLRAALGHGLHRLNRRGEGAILAAAADLLGSTSIDLSAAGFSQGYFHATRNPGARLLSIGGICEDAAAGMMAGVSAFGHHVGVVSSYGAFLAALGHIPARLHAIGEHARCATFGGSPNPMLLVCAHAGLKTGEDGPTHADPQPLQLLQGNFPEGLAITLTPWEPAEVWPLLTEALAARPAVIAPFVTRPAETVPDRAKLGLAPVEAARQGVYVLRRATGTPDAVVVLQGSGVTLEFVNHALPRLLEEGIDVHALHVSSAELFDRLPAERRRLIFPDELAQRAIGITDYTLPTLERWIRSEAGRAASLHPFRGGAFLGSGPGESVMLQAGLDGRSQYEAVRGWVRDRSAAAAPGARR